MIDPAPDARPAEGILPSAYYRRSSAYAYGQTLVPLVVLMALLTLARSTASFAAGAGLIVAIGLVQYRIYFPLHDCSHMSLFRTRTENAIWGHVLAGLLFNLYEGFRLEHMKHHKTYGTPEDPGGVDYWVRFESRGAMVRFFLVPLWGGSLFVKIRDNYRFLFPAKRDRDPSPGRSPRTGRTMALLAIPLVIQGLVCVYVTHWLAELWRYPVFVVLPAITMFLFLSRLRMFLEHGSLDYTEFDYLRNPRVTARTIPSRFPENVVLCGMNFNFHYEHHLFPAVPSCQLALVHHEVTRATMPPEDFVETYGAGLARLWRTLKMGPEEIQRGR